MNFEKIAETKVNAGLIKLHPLLRVEIEGAQGQGFGIDVVVVLCDYKERIASPHVYEIEGWATRTANYILCGLSAQQRFDVQFEGVKHYLDCLKSSGVILGYRTRQGMFVGVMGHQATPEAPDISFYPHEIQIEFVDGRVETLHYGPSAPTSIEDMGCLEVVNQVLERAYWHRKTPYRYFLEADGTVGY